MVCDAEAQVFAGSVAAWSAGQRRNPQQTRALLLKYELSASQVWVLFLLWKEMEGSTLLAQDSLPVRSPAC